MNNNFSSPITPSEHVKPRKRKAEDIGDGGDEKKAAKRARKHSLTLNKVQNEGNIYIFLYCLAQKAVMSLK